MTFCFEDDNFSDQPEIERPIGLSFFLRFPIRPKKLLKKNPTLVFSIEVLEVLKIRVGKISAKKG